MIYTLFPFSQLLGFRSVTFHSIFQKIEGKCYQNNKNKNKNRFNINKLF